MDAAERRLLNREVDAAVFENDAATILATGPGLRPLPVGVVTDLDDAERWTAAFHRCRRVCRVLRTQVDVVLPDGARRAQCRRCPAVVEMAQYCGWRR